MGQTGELKLPYKEQRTPSWQAQCQGPHLTESRPVWGSLPRSLVELGLEPRSARKKIREVDHSQRGPNNLSAPVPLCLGLPVPVAWCGGSCCPCPPHPRSCPLSIAALGQRWPLPAKAIRPPSCIAPQHQTQPRPGGRRCSWAATLVARLTLPSHWSPISCLNAVWPHTPGSSGSTPSSTTCDCHGVGVDSRGVWVKLWGGQRYHGKREVELSGWLKVRPGVQAVRELELRRQWSQHRCLSCNVWRHSVLGLGGWLLRVSHKLGGNCLEERQESCLPLRWCRLPGEGWGGGMQPTLSCAMKKS
ncbi:uncharacterized protein LOC118498022 [Phyllostomus discolor]|uniref:Uncharacterized protein LOC118498022 n=1 Tax=Phyllostomus discolor TaxID=89673 RepID=A0A7E6CU42_9CHIR|nr:uncharacterized protein LOC118498022 [Phyllostomus discolor]